MKIWPFWPLVTFGDLCWYFLYIMRFVFKIRSYPPNLNLIGRIIRELWQFFHFLLFWIYHEIFFSFECYIKSMSPKDNCLTELEVGKYIVFKYKNNFWIFEIIRTWVTENRARARARAARVTSTSLIFEMKSMSQKKNSITELEAGTCHVLPEKKVLEYMKQYGREPTRFARARARAPRG